MFIKINYYEIFRQVFHLETSFQIQKVPKGWAIPVGTSFRISVKKVFLIPLSFELFLLPYATMRKNPRNIGGFYSPLDLNAFVYC